jgi:deoxycytidine triphosphate deaminase
MINGEGNLRRNYPDLDEKQYQPAGIDLRLSKLMILDTNEEVYGIADNVKQLPNQKEVPETAVTIKSSSLETGWLIEPHVPYIGVTKEKIKIDSNSAQIYFPRSSLLRAGVDVRTALGDPGFNGHLSFLLINHGVRPFFIKKDERFAQMIDIQVQGSINDYDGDYNE